MNDESEEPYQNEGTSNETPSFIDGQIDSTNQAQVTQYWIDYKNNWISHNQGELDKEYEVWVQSNINHYVQNQIPDGITDETIFKQTFPIQNFYDEQYNQFMQINFPEHCQQPETDQNQLEICESNDQPLIDQSYPDQGDANQSEQPVTTTENIPPPSDPVPSAQDHMVPSQNSESAPADI